MKPLPQAIHKPNQSKNPVSIQKSGIVLGDNVIWNPAHVYWEDVVLIGASGSGKTQTLKALAYEIPKFFPGVRIILINFHGDLGLPTETYYPLNMESPLGINPMIVDLDSKGVGPSMQTMPAATRSANAVATILKKALLLGANQEGLIIEILNSYYHT